MHSVDRHNSLLYFFIFYFFFIILDVRASLHASRLIPLGPRVTSRVNPLVPPGGLEPVTSEYPSQSFTPFELPLGFNSLLDFLTLLECK